MTKKKAFPEPQPSSGKLTTELENELLIDTEALREAGIAFELLPLRPEEEADDDPLSGRGFGITILEQLLLAVIKAHPQKGGATSARLRKRLDQAMVALTGKKATPTSLPGDQEQAALLWMDRELVFRRRATGVDGTKFMSRQTLERAAFNRFSAHKLAQEAANKFLPHDSRRAAERLRRKFTGEYPKKLKPTAARAADEVATLRYQSREHDDVVGSIEKQDLKKIAALLAKHGIALIIDDEVPDPPRRRQARREARKPTYRSAKHDG